MEEVVYAAAVTGDIDGIVISSKPVIEECYQLEDLNIMGSGFNQAIYILFNKNSVKAYIIKYRKNSYLSRLEDNIYLSEKPEKDITYVVLRVFKDTITRKDKHTSSKVLQHLYPSP